jgi:hypothetical protein
MICSSARARFCALSWENCARMPISAFSPSFGTVSPRRLPLASNVKRTSIEVALRCGVLAGVRASVASRVRITGAPRSPSGNCPKRAHAVVESRYRSNSGM